jgi:hypothetical protein
MRGERRLVERVLLRWTKMAEGRRFPRLNEIDHWMVGEDWANCLLIAVQSPIELSYFTAVGKNLAVALCPEDTLAGVLLSYLPWVVSSRCCLIVEGGATLRSVPILYRGALLPLSEEGGAIDHVLGAANHRELIPDGAPITQAIRKRWIQTAGSCQKAISRSFVRLVPSPRCLRSSEGWDPILSDRGIRWRVGQYI